MLDFVLRSTQKGAPDSVHSALAAIRKHLGMEVAYVSEFVGASTVMREVDAPGLADLVKIGDSRPVDEVYCRHILEGRLPPLMADTTHYPFAMAMPITKAVPIGAYMSVPILRTDGSVYGTFCCLSPHANKSLNDRDLQVMRVFADVTATQINQRIEEAQKYAEKQAHFQQVISQQAFGFVYQPIFDLRSTRPVGFEMLCRFTAEPYRSPDKWFNDAVAVGCGIELELAVIEGAVALIKAFPPDIYLSVNASPGAILSGRLKSLLPAAMLHRLVVELTEHACVEDYRALEDALTEFRNMAGRLAIDDAGAGYASLQHIVQLKPDIIKLDIGLTRTIDTDPARRALAAALIYFAREMACTIVAEGIETEREYETLKVLGVPKGQGYYLGRPMELTSALKLVEGPALPLSARSATR